MASYQTKPAMRSGAACVVLATAMALMTIAIGSAGQGPGGNSLSPRQLFQQATHQEDAAGNLEDALALYRRVLAANPDRALAARAQLRLAVCLEKLGKPEATAALKAVVRDYGDQRDVVAQALERLAATGAPRSVDDRGFVAREIWTGEISRSMSVRITGLAFESSLRLTASGWRLSTGHHRATSPFAT